LPLLQCMCRCNIQFQQNKNRGSHVPRPCRPQALLLHTRSAAPLSPFSPPSPACHWSRSSIHVISLRKSRFVSHPSRNPPAGALLVWMGN
jgi:hypothetical protein